MRVLRSEIPPPPPAALPSKGLADTSRAFAATPTIASAGPRAHSARNRLMDEHVGRSCWRPEAADDPPHASPAPAPLHPAARPAGPARPPPEPWYPGENPSENPAR